MKAVGQKNQHSPNKERGDKGKEMVGLEELSQNGGFFKSNEGSSSAYVTKRGAWFPFQRGTNGLRTDSISEIWSTSPSSGM